MKRIKFLFGAGVLAVLATSAASATRTRAIVESPGAAEPALLDVALWQQFLAIAGLG